MTKDASHHRANKSTIVAFALAFGFYLSACPTLSAAQEVPGIDIVYFYSNLLGEPHRLLVYTPRQMNLQPDSSFPLLIMMDGENLFDGSTSFMDHQEWMIDETLNWYSNAKLIQPPIVVGIESKGPTYRGEDYLPWEDEFLTPPIPNPKGNEFADFIGLELIPWLREQYPVADGQQNVFLGGSSYGGLITLYTGIKHSNVIGNLLIESASFYVNDYAVLDELATLETNPWYKVFIGVGTHEAIADCTLSPTEDIVADSRQLASTIARMPKDYPGGQVQIVVEPCGYHLPSSWARRFRDASVFLFGRD